MMNPPSDQGNKMEIGVLYGFRVMMVACVAAFHFYQQSWMGQTVTFFGITWDVTRFIYSGFMFVDGLILLSGFLLYLPYARETVEGIPVPPAGDFYLRRVKRILPSYWAAILISFFFIALPDQSYGSAGQAAWDLFSHMTFLQMFSRQTYLFSPLNGAVWTIAVEMQLYLLFPLMARAVQRKPVLTLSGMAAIGIGYRVLVSLYATDTAPLVNQMPGFLDVYALGMLGAMLYCRLSRWYQKKDDMIRLSVRIAASACLLVLTLLIVSVVMYQTDSNFKGYEAIRLSQMRLRLPVATLVLAAMLCAAFSLKPLRFLFENKLMKYFAAISMNFYIWHQLIAVRIRVHWIPDMDALHSDPNRQMLYTLLCWLAAFAAALIMTYGVEKPCAALIGRWAKRSRNKKNARLMAAEGNQSQKG